MDAVVFPAPPLGLTNATVGKRYTSIR